MNTIFKEKRFLFVFCLVAWLGVLLQLYLSMETSVTNDKPFTHGLVMYTGYFTVLTNIFVAVLLLLKLTGSHLSWSNDSLRGCATTAILLVGIVYHVVLKDIWEPQGWQWWADVILHYVTPILSLLYWLLFPGNKSFSIMEPVKWIVYPLIYIIYILIRGKVVGLYPYPFLDLTSISIEQFALNSLGILVVYFVIGGALVLIAKWVTKSKIS